MSSTNRIMTTKWMPLCVLAATLAWAGVADASTFFIDLDGNGSHSGPLEIWTPSPDYDPTTTMHFAGSLWSIDLDGVGGGWDGTVMFGDRNATITDIGSVVHSADPMLSQRGFIWDVIGGDPAPLWNPDVPDGDPVYSSLVNGSARYGLAMVSGAGSGIIGGGMTSGTDWQMGIWPWPSIGYDGSVDALTFTWAGDGPGGVNDHFHFEMSLTETNGAWDDTINPPSAPTSATVVTSSPNTPAAKASPPPCASIPSAKPSTADSDPCNTTSSSPPTGAPSACGQSSASPPSASSPTPSNTRSSDSLTP